MDQIQNNGREPSLSSLVPETENSQCLVSEGGREYFLTKAISKKLVFNSQLGWVRLFHPQPAVPRENLVLYWVAPGLPRKFEKQFYFWPS